MSTIWSYGQSPCDWLRIDGPFLPAASVAHSRDRLKTAVSACEAVYSAAGRTSRERLQVAERLKLGRDV